MKRKYLFIVPSIAILLSALLLTGCSSTAGEQSSSKESSPESSVTESQQSKTEEKNSQSESSAPEESPEPSEDPAKAAAEEELEEIKILSDYRNELETNKKEMFTYTEQNHYGNGEFNVSDEKNAEIEYLDSTIWDVNDDGHYEMIVKYKARGTDINGDLDTETVIMYDIVTIVDGKAVGSGHYLNEEGFLNHGARR